MELILQSLRSPSQTVSLTVIDSATLMQCKDTVAGALLIRCSSVLFDVVFIVFVVVVAVEAIPLGTPVIV